VEKLRETFKRKLPIILVDDFREYEADFVYPAEIAEAEVINFMISRGKGLLCVAADEDDLLERGFFRLPSNLKMGETNFFITVDWGNGTGISAGERAETCRKISEGRPLKEFRYPGHVTLLGGKGFNLRRGHTEAAIELVNIAGYERCAVLTEVLDDEGDSHNMEYVRWVSKKYGIPILRVEDVWVEYIKRGMFLRVRSTATLPTDLGVFEIVGFENALDSLEHFAIVKKPFGSPVPVRVHSECLTGEVFSSLRCDCGDQLSEAVRFIANNGGIILYLSQEGRGIGMTNKIEAYNLQDMGYDTVEANIELGFSPDERDYAVAAQMLKALGVAEVVLLTNNPSKVEGLKKYGVKVVGKRKLYGTVRNENLNYLYTKMMKLNHDLEEMIQKVVRR